MKIHIVQKGDTFWEISKEYGVDFEELKQLNPQISSPDMIMPGMKIKIPSSTKPVKKETKNQAIKEQPKKEVKETKEVKPLPKITGNNEPTPIEIKAKVPTNQMPPISPKQLEGIDMQKPQQPIKEMIEMPMMQEEVAPSLPEMPLPNQTQAHTHTEPICHYCSQPCCKPVHYHYYPPMGQMLPDQHIQQGQPMHQPTMPPAHAQYPVNPPDCGCKSALPMQQHHMREIQGQVPQQFPLPNYDQLNQQAINEQLHIQPRLQDQPMYPQFPDQNLNQSLGNPFPMPPGYSPVSESLHQGREKQFINKSLQGNKQEETIRDD